MNEITLMSFGYLYGLPPEADTVIGTRGLPNPYWDEGLKQGTGLDPAVRDYVFSTPEAERFFEAALDLILRRIRFYETYDSPLKGPLVIAVGCSGGRHRSVSMTVRLAQALSARGIPLRVVHRDLGKTLEHSAGAVVFTREKGALRFVIVRSVFGNYGYPKGHMEPGETEQETALREIFEETGLRVRLVPGFRTVQVYPIPHRPETLKQVVYFLAEYENQPLRPQQSELQSAQLLTYEEAMAAIAYESTRTVLRQARDFLDSPA